AAGSVASAERSMNGASAGMAASAAVMGNAANDTRRKVSSIGDSARDTRGQVVNAMNGMTAATSGFTSVMANNARSMEATGRSAQVLRQSSSEAGRGMSLISREAEAANRSLFTSSSAAMAAGSRGGDAKQSSRGFGTFGKASEWAARDLDRFNRTARGFSMAGIVSGLTAVSATVGSLTMFAKYETALADLNKIIDASDSELREYDLAFRELNNTIPATYEEIAEVAAVAAQLGVEEKHLTSFTETMIRMGSSTVLSAEDAAMAIARMTNIMGGSNA